MGLARCIFNLCNQFKGLNLIFDYKVMGSSQSFDFDFAVAVAVAAVGGLLPVSAVDQ
jgi:hypothetical protein